MRIEWFRKAWDGLRFKVWNGRPDPAPVIVARLAIANGELREQLSAAIWEKLAMRDSVVEHMVRERDLLHEISSLKRHLNMAIEERDQARKRKKSVR